MRNRKKVIFSIATLALLVFTFISMGGAFGKEENPSPEETQTGQTQSTEAETESPTGEPSDPTETTTQAPGKKIEARAIEPEFIDLEQWIGTYSVSDVLPDAAAVSDAPDVATFENGNIIARRNGVAVITIPMDNGDTKECYVSVYWNYPQPRIGAISAGHNNVRLCKWAKIGNSDYNGVVLNAGTQLTTLKRVDDQTSPSGGLMIYVRTASGQEGWVDNDHTTGHPMPGYAPDIAVGTEALLDTAFNGNYRTDFSFVSNNTDAVTVTRKTYNGHANQGFITGKAEGHAIVTATSSTTGMKSSLSVTAYTPTNNATGFVKTTCPIYRSTGGIMPVGIRQVGDSVTISGQSGDYWRIGEGRYIHKDDVIIPIAATKVELPVAIAIAKKKSQTLKPIYTPPDAAGYTNNYSSSKTTIASVVSTGKVTAKAKEGMAYVNLTVVNSGPTTTKDPTAKTVVSVYTPVKAFTVMTTKVNVLRYGGPLKSPYTGYPELKSLTTKIQTQGTLLKVDGTYGKNKWYHVKHLSDPSKSGYVLQDDVEKVILSHKTMAVGQSFKPNAFKSAKNIKVTSKILSGSSVLLNKTKGSLTGKKEGTTFISVTRQSTTNKNNKTIYQMHVTIATDVAIPTGYLTKDTKTYKCAKTSCLTRTLPAGTKVSVLSGVGTNWLRVKYTVGSKTETQYVSANSVAYFTMSPVVLKTKGDAKNSAPTWYNIASDEKILRTATVNSDIVSTQINGNKVQLTSKSTNGFTLLTATAGNDQSGNTPAAGQPGRFKAYAPVSVYEPMKNKEGKQYKAFAKKQTNLRSGASNKIYCPVKRKLAKKEYVTIIGKAAGYYYVKTNNQTPEYGFVARADIVYFEVLGTKRKALNKNTKTPKTVKVKIYNGGEKSCSWSKNNFASFIRQKGSSQNKAYKEKVWTVPYKIYPKGNEGAVNATANVGKLKDHCFISAYTPWGGVDGFTKADTTKRCIASDNTAYNDIHPTLGTIKENTGVQIIGKCGKWLYIKPNSGGSAFWVSSSRVVYITLSNYSVSMFRYHHKTINAYLNNSTEYNKITGESSNKKQVTVKDKNGNGKQKLVLWAERPTPKDKNGNPIAVKITAEYKYGDNKCITRTATVEVKNIRVLIQKKKELFPGSVDKLKAEVETLPKAKVKWSTSDKSIVTVSKTGTIKGKKAGTAKITAKYRDIKGTCKVKVVKTEAKNDSTVKKKFGEHSYPYYLQVISYCGPAELKLTLNYEINETGVRATSREAKLTKTSYMRHKLVKSTDMFTAKNGTLGVGAHASGYYYYDFEGTWSDGDGQEFSGRLLDYYYHKMYIWVSVVRMKSNSVLLNQHMNQKLTEYGFAMRNLWERPFGADVPLTEKGEKE